MNTTPGSNISLFLRFISLLLVKKNWRRLYMLAFTIFAGFALCKAQSGNTFKIFFEKVYLQTDKDYYAAGDDLWFSAYLVNAQTGIRINTSNTLYVELITPKNEVITRRIIRLDNGLGNGDFVLPPNVASGNFRLRAYTNWMRNFGKLFFFEKTIQVAYDGVSKGTVPARYTPNFVYETNRNTGVGKNKVQFFPEGGNLLADVPNLVAFKAWGSYGENVSLKGKIVTSAGDSVAAIITSHSGMGSFYYTPKKGVQYLAVGQYSSNEMFSLPLPTAQQTGYALHLEQVENIVRANVQAAPSAALEKLKLVVRYTGKKLFADSAISFANRTAELKIPIDQLGNGVHIVTLYDDLDRPQCERLLYVENKPLVQLKIADLQKKEDDNELIELLVADAKQNPLQARLSLAVTDADIIPVAEGDIVSYLMLESELKGHIDNASQYFNPDNKNRLSQLDILLQTQGWRQFLWRRLQDTQVVIRNMPEPGITVSGEVRKLLGKKGLEDMHVTLYAEKTKGDKLFVTQTNKEGRYYFDGIPLYGDQNIRLSTRNRKTFKREGEIFMDSMYQKSPQIYSISDNIFDTSADSHKFWQGMAAYNKIKAAEARKDTSELLDVTITSNQNLFRLGDQVLMRFGPDSFFTIKPQDAELKTLANYILYKFPGARTDANTDGFYFLGDRGAIIRPRWIVNGREDRFSLGNPMLTDEETGMNDGAFERIDYYNIYINKVKTVRVTATNGGYIISLDLLPGALNRVDFTIINTAVSGYYEARQYFEPPVAAGNTPAKDVRTTLFWAPLLQTDAAGKVSVSYKGNSAKNKWVVVQGVTDNGQPVTGSKIFRKQ